MKNQNNITELVFILDKSGSMGGLESDTVGGFNAMIAKQKKEPGMAYVTTILFNHRSETIHDRIPLTEVPPLTDREYSVSGCTALLDAIGDAVQHISEIHKYIRPEDVPAHTMFVITTDGLENASHRFTHRQIRSLIEQKKEADGWEFLFAGANIDAVEVAESVGISRERTANYVADGAGTGRLFEALSAPISAMRGCKKIDRAWAETLEDDKRKRG
ncbi:MAG: VWA domain-containing protein [Oscillospiraceae bacterium]|nr:VWA domain-containing protein [Oscillospiraceae bacterium]MBR1898631.1 VWA domain-containing protein [Oscillospiraceae bacterium]